MKASSQVGLVEADPRFRLWLTTPRRAAGPLGGVFSFDARNLIALKCVAARAAGLPPREKRREAGALLLTARRLALVAAGRGGSAGIRAARASAAGRTALGRRRGAGIALAGGALANGCPRSFCAGAADCRRGPAAHAGPRRHSAIDRYAGVPLFDDDGARGLVVPRVATLLDDRCRGLAINKAGLLALDDDGVVARGGAHADRCMAAAVDRHAIAAGPRANPRAAAPLRLAAHHGPAAARLAGRRAAALRIASRCRAAVAIAGTALLARAHAGPRLRVLRLRELDAAGGRIGRGRGSDGDHRRGPEDHCKCSHLFLLMKVLPGRQSGRACPGFRARQNLSG